MVRLLILSVSCVTTNHQQQTGVVVATTSHYHLSTSFLSADTSAPTPPLGLLCQTRPGQARPVQSSPVQVYFTAQRTDVRISDSLHRELQRITERPNFISRLDFCVSECCIQRPLSYNPVNQITKHISHSKSLNSAEQCNHLLRNMYNLYRLYSSCYS